MPRSLTQLPGSCPVTWSVIGVHTATFVVAFVVGGSLWEPFIFRTNAVLGAPWSLLTYPLIGTGILWVLLGGYMMWMFGGSLERAWGIAGYIRFLILVTLGTAAGLWLGATLLGRAGFLAGLGLPLAAVTVAWAAINPSERLLLYFVLPIESRWLAIGVAVLVFFSFPFPLGFFALAGCGIAWWYVRAGRYVLLGGPASRRPRRARGPERRTTLNPFALYRRWRLKRQFTRLMRGSSMRDDETIH
ncbi:MAG TPA: DUF1751 domain-containing protein [bacterium]